MIVLERTTGHHHASNEKPRQRPPPCVVRQIEWERFNPDDPFPIIQPRSTRQDVKPKVAVLTVGRSSVLFNLLLWLLPFIQADNLNVLPSAILVYSLGICYLHELLVDILADDFNQDDLARQYQQEEYFKQQYQRAAFELHVLQGRPNVRLVRRTENGVTTLYAID